MYIFLKDLSYPYFIAFPLSILLSPNNTEMLPSYPAMVCRFTSNIRCLKTAAN